MSGATAAEFAKWTSMASKCTDDELAFVIQDCREAGEAMRGWNPEKENYYADQRMTYSDERCVVVKSVILSLSPSSSKMEFLSDLMKIQMKECNDGNGKLVPDTFGCF